MEDIKSYLIKNIEINNPFTVFSVKELQDALRPVAMFVILDFIWTRVKKDLKPRLLVVDEAWHMMRYPDTAQFFPIMVYPGTEAYRWAEENGYLTTTNWDEWLLPDGTHNTIISTPSLNSGELVRECDRARISFYLRPKFMTRKLKQVIMNPKDIPRTFISTLVFAKYLGKEINTTLFTKA